MTSARIVSLCIGLVGVAAVGLSLLPIGFGALGFIGVLADVSPAENRQMGLQLLAYGLPLLLGGVLLFGVGLAMFFASRRR